MATQLKNIVAFVNVAAGALATLAHDLNIIGEGGVIPDEVKLDHADFAYVVADATNITVRNTGPIIASCNALVEHWHTIERTFGPEAIVDLVPQPFVGAGAGGGGGAMDRYSPPEKWTQQNVAAGQANVDMSAMVSTSFDTIKMIRPGSIIGLSTRLVAAITDANINSLVVSVTINGVAGALTLSHAAGGNPTGGEAVQAAGIDIFAAGDLIGIEVTSTLGTFAPAQNDLEAWLDMEF